VPKRIDPIARFLGATGPSRRARCSLSQPEPETDSADSARIRNANPMPAPKPAGKRSCRGVAEQFSPLAGCRRVGVPQQVGHQHVVTDPELHGLEARAAIVEDPRELPIRAYRAVASLHDTDPRPNGRLHRSPAVSLTKEAFNTTLDLAAVGHVLDIVHAATVGSTAHCGQAITADSEHTSHKAAGFGTAADHDGAHCPSPEN
jgi:hypothetical protein